MTSPIPAIEAYMTPSPHSVGADQTLATARTIMRKYKIRHLPVMRAGRVIGIVSTRDLDFVEALAEIDPEKVTVEEAMSQEPYCVAPETPVDEVALEMAKQRYGCAIVKKGDKLFGIFTTVDGMRLLGETLRRATAREAKPAPSRRARASGNARVV